MTEKTKLYQQLLNILNNKDLAVFHKPIKEVLDHHKKLSEIAYNTSPTKGCNEIRVDNQFYSINALGTPNSIFATYGVKKDQFSIKTNTLRKAIDKIMKDILNSTVSGVYVPMLKVIFLHNSAKFFLHDYLHSVIITGNKTNYVYKKTTLSINLAEALFQFLLSQVPELKLLFSSFDYHKMLFLNNKQIKSISNFVTILFKNDSKELAAYFNKHNIKNEPLQKHLKEYLKDVFMKEYDKNTIYIEEVKNTIKLADFETSKLDNRNNVNKFFTTFGTYVIMMFIPSDNQAFTTKTVTVYDPTEKKHRHYDIISPIQEVIDDALLNKPAPKHFLTEEQLYITHTETQHKTNEDEYRDLVADNVSKLIHENPRITLALEESCYMRYEKIYTKLSIDVNYLSTFLNLLDEGLSETYILYLFDIDTKLIAKLGHNNKPLQILFQIIKDAAINFKNDLTATNLQKRIDAKIRLLIRDNNSTTKQSLANIKEVLYDMINKLCYRKQQLISLISDSILYSLFKYFIAVTYIDSRGRSYLEAFSLNILTNPQAKLFVNLYDPNEGANPNKRELNIIKSSLNFKQTQDKIEAIINENLVESANISNIQEYICTYLNIESVNFKSLVENDHYMNNRLLLNHLATIIKKPKKLYYVHKLICYEQLRFRNIHDTIICNYIQKDASSSGFQVMATFFGDESLARIGNLIGKKDFNVYLKATNYCGKIYSEFNTLAEDALSLFNAEDLLDDTTLTLSLQAYTQDYYNANIKSSATKKKYLKTLVNINLIISSISHEILQKLEEIIEHCDIPDCEHLLQYLPSSHKTLIDDLVNLTLFKNSRKILSYLLCIKYGIRLKFICEKILMINDSDSYLWNDRTLTKSHVMTTLYRSTPYGRRVTYIKFLKEHFIIKQDTLHEVEEFATFLEQTTSIFLSNTTNIKILYDFADELSKNKVIIRNRNFKITIDPKITTEFQVSCSSFYEKRGPQLVLHLITNKSDKKKLKTMLMANIAHYLDSDIMHHFVELCRYINKKSEENGSSYRLAYERNHDCFILNCPILLPILLEEAYLRFCSQDNMNFIRGLSPEIIAKYRKLSVNAFLALVDPINPYFIK